MAKRTPIDASSVKVSPEPNSGCWLWLGRLSTTGYGKARRSALAHRAAWEDANGPIPPDRHVLHRCDTPACVNPAHLFLGTHDDNMADKRRKGRAVAGTQHGQARLTESDVLAMRAMSGNASFTEIARRFGVARSTATRAIQRRLWSHL